MSDISIYKENILDSFNRDTTSIHANKYKNVFIRKPKP